MNVRQIRQESFDFFRENNIIALSFDDSDSHFSTCDISGVEGAVYSCLLGDSAGQTFALELCADAIEYFEYGYTHERHSKQLGRKAPALTLVKCEVTEDEMFKARMKRWKMASRNK